MHAESRSTPTDLDTTAYNPSSGAGGIYGVAPATWNWYAGKHGWFLRTKVQNRSVVNFTALEQTIVFIDVIRADGWSPWKGDGCV
jgi:hypothetical protein